MCEPFDNYEEPLRGVSSEIISGMSSLNMEPEPVKEPGNCNGYISDLDENVKHAMTHFKKAFDLLIQHNKEESIFFNKIKELLFKASFKKPGFDLYKELEKLVYGKQGIWDKVTNDFLEDGAKIIASIEDKGFLEKVHHCLTLKKCSTMDGNGNNCNEKVVASIQKGDWECFCDDAYYGMWAIKRKDCSEFLKTIHVHTENEAEFLRDSLNELDSLKKVQGPVRILSRKIT